MTPQTLTIIRASHDKEHPFALISRETLQDETLSFEALGALSYLLSKPDDWKVMVADLQRRCGRDKAKRILAELVQAGYIVAQRCVNALTKRFEPTRYSVHETPFTEKPSVDNPVPGNPPVQDIDQQNPESTKKYDSKIISDSGERDFEPEGIDQSKFFQDDPSPNAEDVPQYLRRQVPSAAVRQQLSAYSLSLGLKLYAEVMTRCANARSWEYVLKALANEPIPSPRFASPPSPAADAPTEPDWTEDDIPGNDTPALDDDLFAKPVAVEDVRQAWLKAHVAPALLANGGVQW